MFKKNFYKILVAIALLTISMITVIEYCTSYHIPEHILSEGRTKAWSHAGYHINQGVEANTMESFENAQRNGAYGLELDVHYDKDLKRYIVSHDPTYSEKDKNLLFLDSVFVTYGNSFKYWLDFKNLKDLSPETTLESLFILNNIISDIGVNKRNILIESVSLENLTYYTQSGYYTSWWVLPYKSRYRSIFRNYKYKFYFVLGKYSSLSMPYSYYSRIEGEMNNIPINLWTINDKNVFDELRRKYQVKIILTDKNWFGY